MMRGAKCRSIVACALTLAAITASPMQASAKPAAVEEYVLTLPGVESSGVGRAEPREDLARRADPVGVSGEVRPGPSRLAAAGGALASPAGLVLVAGAAGAIALALRRRGG